MPSSKDHYDRRNTATPIDALCFSLMCFLWIELVLDKGALTVAATEKPA